jgi:toxin-antitoxin system PIN domain toxin
VKGIALLDVNVLVALFDSEHPHHDAAHRWFAAQRESGWATCSITENGAIRVLSNPAYTPLAERPVEVIERLRALRSSGGHAFWRDDVSLCDNDRLSARAPIGHRQVTDAHLLALAVARAGYLATFDRGIEIAWVAGAGRQNLRVLEA